MTKRKPAKVQVAVGDHVLIGGTRASYPGDWYVGTVLWVGKGDALVERYTLNGETWRQLISLLEIRAKGDALSTVQRAAAEAVREKQEAVREAEQALNRARSALFAKLDELAEGGLQVIPPDFDAIDARDTADRKVWERAEAEHEAARKASPDTELWGRV